MDGKNQLSITLKDVPDSLEAERTIVAIREAAHAIDPDALVGGTTATALDTQVTAQEDFVKIIPLVLGAILIILMLLLRSVVAPLVLILTTVLSYGAAMGVSAWVFNGLFNFPGADPAVPLFGFVFLVALGVDYNIFLMTRVLSAEYDVLAREAQIDRWAALLDVAPFPENAADDVFTSPYYEH